jgi:glycerol-3-phosphate dehydrogenase (NAD(P)+)
MIPEAPAKISTYHAPIGVVTGGPLGRSLAARLEKDGRTIVAAGDRAGFAELARRARLILFDAHPTEVRALARSLGEFLDGNHLVAHVVRGLIGDGAGAGQVLHEESAVRRIGVLAGPISVAALDEGRPSAAVIASRHPEVVDEFAAALSTPRLRVYRSHDPLGVELATGLCDLVTAACGLAHSLGFGDTTRAVMIVRSVRELSRLVAALGGDPTTPSGLAGLGDILVHALDPNDPAFQLGANFANAPSHARAALTQSARTLHALARQHRVTAHIFEALAQLLDGHTTPHDLVTQLMSLPVLDD